MVYRHVAVQVTDLITDIHRSLADCLFCVSAQSGLGRADILLLLGHLSEEKSLAADGAMTDVTVVLTMAALYAIDVRILEQEDADGIVNVFHHIRAVLSHVELIRGLNCEFCY